jgi:hypothetical protein
VKVGVVGVVGVKMGAVSTSGSDSRSGSRRMSRRMSRSTRE